MTTDQSIRSLAEKIANRLFTNGAGQKAKRLVLELEGGGGGDGGGWCRDAVRDVIKDALSEPINMILHCPNCGIQHVDAPEPGTDWNNPPHKSHKCRPQDGGCGMIWRPADVPTNGVATIETRGDADTWPKVKKEE